MLENEEKSRWLLPAADGVSPVLINGVWIDPITGEVLHNHVQGEEYIQPLDVTKIINRQVFEEEVRNRIGRKKWKLMVSPLLLDLVTDRNISIAAISVFCCLGRNVSLYNLCCMSVQEVVDQTVYKKQTVNEAIRDLKEGGYLKEVVELEGKDRLFCVNPLYFFLGFYPYREKLLRDWMRGVIGEGSH